MAEITLTTAPRPDGTTESVTICLSLGATGGQIIEITNREAICLFPSATVINSFYQVMINFGAVLP